MGLANGSRFVTKDRLIYILLAIIAFMASFTIYEKVAAIQRNTDDISVLKAQFAEVQSELSHIREAVDEIKSAVKDDKKKTEDGR
jgi:peptidoglycan hydrolase CwlO-like protein